MAFRETVRAKSLDLIEAAFREFGIVAARDHVVDQLGFEFAHGADIAECRHRAAQSIGLLGAKFRGLDGDPHRLFLEQRHAEGLVQDPAQFILVAMRRRRRWIAHIFLAVSAPQIGMHHVALDRAGPHDRDFDNKIVECPRLQPRQHVHLRAAFDLEYAERLAPLQHPVNFVVIF